MKKSFLALFLLIFTFLAQAQVNSSSLPAERFPIFPGCENLEGLALENCFYNKVQSFVFQNFVVPENLVKNNFKGDVKVLFEVDAQGIFKVIYVNAVDENLIQEAKRVFAKFSKIKPSTYIGKPIYARYNITIAIPLQSPDAIVAENVPESVAVKSNTKQLTELESIVYKKYNSPELVSSLRIPFSHSSYAQFDGEMNQVGSNNHTASKPYSYAEVAKYYDIQAANQKLNRNTTSWLGRKLWNENLVEIQGEGYWFTLNPIVDLQVGKSSDGKASYTYVNTRGINFRGGLGESLTFSTTVFESQGRFADYFNRYAESIRPAGGNPAIIPGVGIAKDFKTDSYDFPLADANITFTPSKNFDLQLGYGKNFIGDGYRSLLATDGASPYPYVKLNTTFWKIKYTNTYMWLKDVRPEVTLERTYATKFMANHYLSWNVSRSYI